MPPFIIEEEISDRFHCVFRSYYLII